MGTFPGNFGTSAAGCMKCRVFQGFVAFLPIFAPEARTRGKTQKTGDHGCHDTRATTEAVTAAWPPLHRFKIGLNHRLRGPPNA